MSLLEPLGTGRRYDRERVPCKCASFRLEDKHGFISFPEVLHTFERCGPFRVLVVAHPKPPAARLLRVTWPEAA